MSKGMFEKSLEKIKSVLDFVVNNKYSDFYRKKYRDFSVSQINTYKDFKKLSFLTKDEITAIPIDKRTFVPKNEVTRYCFSSGTTTKLLPLIVPRSNRADDDLIDKFQQFARKEGVKKVLVLFPPSATSFFIPPITSKQKVLFIPGDIRNLEVSACISKELGVQGIRSTPTILYFITNIFNKIGFDKSSIKTISLMGEFCTSQKLTFFKDQFPKAFFNIKYGASEAGGAIGYRCGYLQGSSPSIYHPRLNNHFLELIDDEIVLSNLTTGAFPLIRYRLGDVASIFKQRCECGNDWIIKLGGRANYDVLKFHGVVLYAQLIDESLAEVANFLEPVFQMHVYEEIEDDKIRPRLKLKLKLKEELKPPPSLLDFIRTSVTKRLFLSSDKTLEYFVKNDIFLPLQIEFSDDWPTGTKPKNIVSHLK